MRSLSTSLSGGSFYGREQFKPGEIIAQLVVIQVLLYTADSILLGVLDYMLGVGDFFAGNISKGAPKNIILEQVFNPDIPSLRSSPGMTLLCEVLSRRLELREIAVPTHDIENQPQNDAVNGIRPT